MPARRSRRPDVVIAVATLLASVGLHIVLWPIGNRLVSLGDKSSSLAAPGGMMEVSLLPNEPDERQDEPPKPDPPKEPEEHRRVVNLDDVVDERPPEDAKYSAEFDNRVERETRAPNRQPSKAAAAPQPPAPQPASAPQASQSARDAREASSAEMVPGEDVPLHERGSLAQSKLREQRDGSEAEQSGRAAPVPNLRRLPPSALERYGGGPGTTDLIDEDAELGTANLLNSKRWKYASFFNRVRNQVAQHWHPEVVHAARDPHGRVFGTKTRKTLLVISLNPDGSLNRVRLDPGNGSGAAHLDEEAIRAVRAAAPFSNPPPQLVSKETGLIEFGFGFIFEISGSTKIFRYQR